MKNITVGTRMKDTLGNLMECVKIDGLLYELKFVGEDGTLSVGSVIAVPSHMENYEIVEDTLTRQDIIDVINAQARDCIDSYYKERTADNFFRIDDMVRACQKYNVTKEEVPTLIEMQNIIVMG